MNAPTSRAFISDERIFMSQNSASNQDDTTPFFPTGAIVFFVLLVGFFGAVWLGLYALMISRH
jgi:hypothetical protein